MELAFFLFFLFYFLYRGLRRRPALPLPLHLCRHLRTCEYHFILFYVFVSFFFLVFQFFSSEKKRLVVFFLLLFYKGFCFYFFFIHIFLFIFFYLYLFIFIYIYSSLAKNSMALPFQRPISSLVSLLYTMLSWFLKYVIPLYSNSSSSDWVRASA